jgi:hypothetical protein
MGWGRLGKVFLQMGHLVLLPGRCGAEPRDERVYIRVRNLMKPIEAY